MRPNGSTPFGWPLTPSPGICLKGRQGFGSNSKGATQSVYGGLYKRLGDWRYEMQLGRLT